MMRVPIFVARKFAALVLVVLGVTLVTFVISHVIPGDPARLLAGPRASADAVAKLRGALGLDQPVLQQYLHYLGELLRGEFGLSIVTGRPVLYDLLQVAPATLGLALAAIVLATFAGLTLGILSALFRGSWFDLVARIFSSVAVSVPSFWLALVLLLTFYGALDLLPGDGRLSPSFDPPTARTGLFLIDALLDRNLPLFFDALTHLALPAATLAFASTGGILRLMRASMLDVLQEDYIRTAVAGGLSRRAIVLEHALPNALAPFTTVLGLEFAALLFGTIVVESVFVWPGAGAYVLSAVFALDFPMIMCFTLLVSVAYVAINLGFDLLQRLVSPQLREAQE
jgi:peptide/nickel transport system permease protein